MLLQVTYRRDMATTTEHRRGTAHCAERDQIEAERLATDAVYYGRQYLADPEGSEGCLYEARRLQRIANALNS